MVLPGAAGIRETFWMSVMGQRDGEVDAATAGGIRY